MAMKQEDINTLAQLLMRSPDARMSDYSVIDPTIPKNSPLNAPMQYNYLQNQYIPPANIDPNQTFTPYLIPKRTQSI